MYIRYGMSVIGLEGCYYDYNAMLKLKVYSLDSVSKVKGLLSPYEPLWAIIKIC